MLLWKSNGWWGDEKEALTPLFSLLLPSSSPPSFPRVDINHMTQHPSLLAPLKFPLSTFLTSFHSSSYSWRTVTYRRLKNSLVKERYIEVLTRQTMCSVARDEFGNVGFDHRFRPRALFRVKTFTSPPLPSPTIFLQPVIQRAAAHTNFLPSLQHTARERLSFINIHFSC